MKQGKLRTMSICLTELKKAVDHFQRPDNGKIYVQLQTWDHDEPDKYGNDFSVSVCFNQEESKRAKAGEKNSRIFVGNGKIWEPKQPKPVTPAEIEEDLPF